MAEPRLDDPEVRQRLALLDELLARLERTPGAVGELALDAVAELTAVYGEALARCVDHAAAAPAVLESLTGDELLGHLLVLHDLHPEPVDRRVARAVDELRGPIAERGGSLELVDVDAGVVTLRLATGGCASSGADVTDGVRESLLAIAPELVEVRCVPPARQPTFVSMNSLMRPATSAGPRP